MGRGSARAWVAKAGPTLVGSDCGWQPGFRREGQAWPWNPGEASWRRWDRRDARTARAARRLYECFWHRKQRSKAGKHYSLDGKSCECINLAWSDPRFSW